MPINWSQEAPKKAPLKTILLHLPEDMVVELNTISKELGIARAELIRRCLRRDLAFVKAVELRGVKELSASFSRQYREYMHI
jgi:metal-responsive CopG/Arc/MetJ family transcriptional regulator